jgi:hypothetical protein
MTFQNHFRSLKKKITQLNVDLFNVSSIQTNLTALQYNLKPNDPKIGNELIRDPTIFKNQSI